DRDLIFSESALFDDKGNGGSGEGSSPNLFGASAAAVGPASEEVSRETREADIIAVLKICLGTCRRFVGSAVVTRTAPLQETPLSDEVCIHRSVLRRPGSPTVS